MVFGAAQLGECYKGYFLFNGMQHSYTKSDTQKRLFLLFKILTQAAF